MSKRFFDIVLSTIGIICILPILIIVSILIKFLMSGPVFFIQERSGRFGKVFKIIKFRTMVVNHEGNTVSVKGENRITSLGAILRKYKVDELPELFNVLKGEMSFVGPRPDMPEMFDNLKGEDRNILKLRPGITGPASLKYANEEELLASVSDPEKYNNEVIWPDKVRLNLDYYYNRNFFIDLKLIFQTVLGKGGR